MTRFRFRNQEFDFAFNSRSPVKCRPRILLSSLNSAVFHSKLFINHKVNSNASMFESDRRV